jgi:hypothetical protein
VTDGRPITCRKTEASGKNFLEDYPKPYKIWVFSFCLFFSPIPGTGERLASSFGIERSGVVLLRMGLTRAIQKALTRFWAYRVLSLTSPTLTCSVLSD